MSAEGNVAVVGLGKIGLPLAVQFAKKGKKVFGVDINKKTVELINQGEVPFLGEEDLAKKLEEVVSSGRLIASTSISSAVANSKVIVVVVPLYVGLDGNPDFHVIDTVTNEIGQSLQEGSLVSYETTLPIGVTRNRFTVALAKLSGLEADKSFHVVFSPERVLTGRVFSDLRKYPKLVGGIGDASEHAGVSFYESVLEFDERPDLLRRNGVWPMGSTEAAEFTKLAETTYRDVNIALINQFTLYAEKNNLDIHKVIDAANSQPFSHLHRPGIAVGGHCIPVYPQLYLWNDQQATLVKLARNVNSGMPSRMVDRLSKLHGNLSGQAVVVLGISYRGGVKETAFSGIFPLVEQLVSCGASVSVHDPLFSNEEILQLGFIPYSSDKSTDAIVVQADHQIYKTLTPKDFPGVQTALDGRGILDELKWKGTRFHLIGKSHSMRSDEN